MPTPTAKTASTRWAPPCAESTARCTAGSTSTTSPADRAPNSWPWGTHARPGLASCPGIRVILPTPEGIRSVKITDLMPLGAVWSATEGTQSFDPAIFEDAPDS
jgi:hypothetical protein